MVLLYRRILEHIGLNPERLRIRFMSGAEANVFVESVNDFVKKIKELGPLGKAEGMDKDNLNAKLAEVKKLVPYFKVAMREKLATRLESHEEYDNTKISSPRKKSTSSLPMSSPTISIRRSARPV